MFYYHYYFKHAFLCPGKLFNDVIIFRCEVCAKPDYMYAVRHSRPLLLTLQRCLWFGLPVASADHPNFLASFSPYQWLTQEFCSAGVQQIQLRTEGRENGDLGAIAP
jgi:hypothetical protein